MKRIFSIIFAAVTAFILTLPLSSCGKFLQVKTKSFTESGRIERVKIDYENANISLQFEKTAQSVSAVYSYLTKGEEIVSEAKAVEEDGVLTITEKRVDKISFGAINLKDTPAVDLILPVDRIYKVEVKTINGSITVSGDARAEWNAFTASTVNGEIELQSEAYCSGGVELITVNGAIEVGALSAEILTAETENGAVTLQNEVAARAVTLSTSNGAIKASAGIKASIIDLETEVGAITAKVVGKKEDYSISVETELGKSNLQSAVDYGKVNTLEVETEVGEVQISFTN